MPLLVGDVKSISVSIRNDAVSPKQPQEDKKKYEDQVHQGKTTYLTTNMYAGGRPMLVIDGSALPTLWREECVALCSVLCATGRDVNIPAARDKR